MASLGYWVFMLLQPCYLTRKPHCVALSSWWRHQMETFSALLAISAGNSPVPVNSPHKGQWRGAFMFSLICAWINRWVKNREAGDLRRRRTHYDVIVMYGIIINVVMLSLLWKVILITPLHMIWFFKIQIMMNIHFIMWQIVNSTYRLQYIVFSFDDKHRL